MIKTVNIRKKCAEIHCDALIEPKYSIKCICGIILLEYDAFRVHFNSEHLTEQEKDNTKLVAKTDEPLADCLGKTDEPIAECLEEPLFLLSASSGESESDTLLTTKAKDKDSTQQRRTYKPRDAPNICNYCGRTFRRRYLLETHLNIHTGQKPHQCEMCGKQFRAVSTLTRHLRTHEKRQALQCKHCEKLFTHRNALVSHEMRHTQVRRWACNSCEKCFYTRNQMDTHRRKLHANNSTQRTIDNSLSLSTHTHLPFACELCSNSYRTASMLSTHRLKKHHRLAKFRCELCDKKFVDSERLQQHKKIHEKLEV